MASRSLRPGWTESKELDMMVCNDEVSSLLET